MTSRRAAPHRDVVNLVRSGRKQPQPLSASAGGPARLPPIQLNLRDVASGPCTEVAATRICVACRSGTCSTCFDSRAANRSYPSRVFVHRDAGRREDFDCAHPREGAQLRSWCRSNTLRALQCMCRNRQRAVPGLHRNGCRQQPGCRRDGATTRCGCLRAGRGAH